MPHPFVVSLAIMGAIFALPYYHLSRFALASDLYSYTVSIPLITGYLLWHCREKLGSPLPLPRLGPLSWLTGLLGIGCGIAYLVIGEQGRFVDRASISLAMVAFTLLTATLFLSYFGSERIAQLSFPLGFLLLSAPIPEGVESFLVRQLQDGSAFAAYVLFSLSGMPVYNSGTRFQLPGIVLEVAPECSGAQSTLALAITSLIAGYLLLRSGWLRVILAVAVIPIALLRNGLRVFTIGQLCVRVSPDMIHSWIHVHGGPVFFLLSLIPFSLVLALLLRVDRRGTTPA